MPRMNTATLDAAIPPHNPVPLKQDAAVIGLVGLAHATSHFSHLLLAPLFPIFMRDFGLSYSDVGLLMTMFFVISGIGQALSGLWSTASARARCCSRPSAVFLLASLAASMATGYGGLVLVACWRAWAMRRSTRPTSPS
jgi:MFS transporter, FSR family, fosmidomycin resistance protein